MMPPRKEHLLGTVVVGPLDGCSSSQRFGPHFIEPDYFPLWQRCRGEHVVRLQEQEVVRQIQDLPTQEQAYIGNERF